MKLKINDILEFIDNADMHELSEISDAITDQGYEFECDVCDNHVCDHEEEIHDSRFELLQSLVNRLDQFGLDDMLEEMKKECYQVGVNMRVPK